MTALLLAVLACAPQAQDPQVFTVAATASASGAVRRTVSADQRQIRCMEALRELASAMNWNLDVDSTPLENDLRFASVDLNLADQDPRMVAQLIAVAGGADTVFDEPADFEGARVTLHVVHQPSAETESGRQRLRAVAGQWYRSFLREELAYEPLVEQEGNAVRMHLGELLVEAGDLDSAIGFFQDVYDQKPNDYMVRSILKMAACHLDLAGDHVERERQHAEYAEAQRWVDKVLEGEATLSNAEFAAAATMLGRALIGQARSAATPSIARVAISKCREQLRAKAYRLLHSKEVVEVWLVQGQAHYLAGDGAAALKQMRMIRAQEQYFADLTPAQYRDYHFLLGYGALETGDSSLAMRALEWYLIHAEDDSRRGEAYVMLADAYYAAGRYLEGRAASVEARTRYLPRMSKAWQVRTLKIWARTALALGDKEDAFLELEQLVLSGDEPALTLFLMDELLEDRQWQRTMSVARVLAERDDDYGDQARYRHVVALYRQAVAGGHLADFPQMAIAIAPRVRDTELRRKVAEMIGEAYTQLEMLEHAADAFRGILR